MHGNTLNNQANKDLVYKNNAPFRSFISKINNAFKDNAENIDTVMPIYNLLEHNNSYSVR